MRYRDEKTSPGTRDTAMLKRMREGSAYFIKGVMLLVVAAFIGTIFVVWGVKSTPGDLGRRGIVATVSGTEISLDDYQQALRQQIEAYKQLFGDRFDQNMQDSLDLKRQVVEQLIRRVLVLQYAKRVGIGVSADELADQIRRMPAFSGKDGFSRQRYLDILRANRLTPERFEADMRQEMTQGKVETLIRGAVKLSEGEAKEAFRLIHRQVTAEVVQLPAGEEGKKLADKITVDVGQGKTLAAAAREAKAIAKTYGPFPLDALPKEIPDPDVFRQGVSLLWPGETSPLVAGQKASYLIHLVSQQDPPDAEYDNNKDKDAFRAQLLLQKRTAVFADWLLELRRQAKVTIDQDIL
jgi:parvulin-like peptidyl-prolyl isomerase